MNFLSDPPIEGASSPEPSDPSVVVLETRRSRRARAEAAIAALEQEFLDAHVGETASPQQPVITHVIFSDEHPDIPA